LVLKVKFN